MPANLDEFGRSVAVEGDVAVVGAHFDDENGTDSGAAYIYRRISCVWILEQRITAPTPLVGDNFGTSVDVNVDLDGTSPTIVVGSPLNNGPGAADAGAVDIYVYDGVGPIFWEHQARIVDSARVAGDKFGSAVAVDGDYCVVGIPEEGNFGGAAFFNRTGVVWSLQNVVLGASPTTANLGTSVDIEGTTAVVGDPGYDWPNPAAGSGANSGSAIVYVENAGTWVQEGANLASFVQTGVNALGTGDNFGRSVGISGDTVVVGALTDDNANGVDAGSLYTFLRDEGSWSFSQKLVPTGIGGGARMGWSSAIDGDVLVGGAPKQDQMGTDSGVAVIYRRTSSSNPFVQVGPSLVSSDIAAFDNLGNSVGIDAGASGDTVIVGANLEDGAGTDRGAAYIFLETAPTATPTPSPTTTTTPTASPTASPTVTETATSTASPSPTETTTPTPSPTRTPTTTPSATPTATPTVSPTVTPSVSPTLTPTVTPTPPASCGTVRYSTSFEIGPFDWLIDNVSLGSSDPGLWHLTTACRAGDPGHFGPTVLAYKNTLSCDYDTVADNAGWVTSPGITVAPSTYVQINFNTFLGVERDLGFDMVTVEFSINGGPWNLTAAKSSTPLPGALLNPSNGWVLFSSEPIHTGSGTTIRFRLTMDTVDGFDNNLEGWYVDDVTVCDTTGP